MRNMYRIISIFAAIALSVSLFAEECQNIYGVASVTYQRQSVEPGSGRFSINDSTVVRFSMGNLYYDYSDSKFRFFEHQYDHINKTTGFGDNAAEDVDLLGYGTSGYDSKSPLLRPDNNGAYAIGNINGTNYDWGQYNVIGTDTVAGIWRTLTYKEWEYLLNERPNFARLRSAAKVNGSFGVVVLPDDWVKPIDCPDFYPLQTFVSVQAYNYNIYTIEQWTILEKAGAVFLPAAGDSEEGHCTGDPVYTYCCYLSATQASDAQVMRIDFGNQDRDPRLQTSDKRFRSSVRLVKEW